MKQQGPREATRSHGLQNELCGSHQYKDFGVGLTKLGMLARIPA